MFTTMNNIFGIISMVSVLSLIKNTINPGQISLLTTSLFFISQFVFVITLYMFESEMKKDKDEKANMYFIFSSLYSAAFIMFIHNIELNFFITPVIIFLYIYFNSVIIYNTLKINYKEIKFTDVFLKSLYMSAFNLFQIEDENKNFYER